MCLIHHSPPVGRAISVCRRKRRRIAICGRFPDPVRCVCWHCLLTKPDAYPTHGRSACCSGWFASWPGSQDGQRMSQTDFSDCNRLGNQSRPCGWHWFRRPGFSQSRQCPCGCFVNKSGLGDKCRLSVPVSETKTLPRVPSPVACFRVSGAGAFTGVPLFPNPGPTAHAGTL